MAYMKATLPFVGCFFIFYFYFFYALINFHLLKKNLIIEYRQDLWKYELFTFWGVISKFARWWLFIQRPWILWFLFFIFIFIWESFGLLRKSKPDKTSLQNCSKSHQRHLCFNHAFCNTISNTICNVLKLKKFWLD